MKLHLNGLTPPSTHQSYSFAIIAVVIFVFCLVGIFSRPLTYLAIFWPANAVLLALFLRFPQLSNTGG